MSIECTSPARSSGPFVVVVLMTLIAVAAGATGMWFVTVYKPKAEAVEGTHARLMTMTGMDRPAANRLAEGFTDADGDLIADVPAGKLLDPPKLVFCYIASEEPAEYAKQWKPFCEHLAKVTGKTVEYQEFTSTVDQLKAVRDGQLQISGFSSGAVPSAVNQCGFVPVARMPTGEASGTHFEIIVPANSPIQSPSDLRNRKYTLALTEPSSNSGYKAPMVLLHSDVGVDPERDYMIRTTGDHRASIEGIAKKEYDAAAVSADLLARELAQGKIKKSDYRTIFKSEAFPSAAIGYAHNLDPALAAKVREAILSFDMKQTPLEAEFQPVTQTTLVPVSFKNDWALIRRIDDACGQAPALK